METALAEYLTHAPVFIRLEDGEIIYWTRGCEELFGYSFEEAQGRISHELLKTEFPEPLATIEAHVRRSGEWRGRLQYTRKDGSHVWTEAVWRRRHAGAQARQVVIVQNTDITDRVRYERQRDLLTRELNHRVKNTLAVVQSLARMSFADADREHVRQFEERLLALSEAHNLLVRESWEKASLRDLLHEVIHAMHLEGRVEIDGPDADLTPNSAVAYALAFHELATNAVKHGALRAPSGRVSVTWRLFDDDRRLHLIWKETGGPEVKPPEKKGFGSRLLERAISRELGTPVELRFEPSGLVCEFDSSLQKSPEGVPPDGASSDGDQVAQTASCRKT